MVCRRRTSKRPSNVSHRSFSVACVAAFRDEKLRSSMALNFSSPDSLTPCSTQNLGERCELLGYKRLSSIQGPRMRPQATSARHIVWSSSAYLSSDNRSTTNLLFAVVSIGGSMAGSPSIGVPLLLQCRTPCSWPPEHKIKYTNAKDDGRRRCTCSPWRSKSTHAVS